MANLKVGRPDVAPDAPSHVAGINEGNAKGNYASQRGMQADGRRTAESATSIDASHHGPIDKRMPSLPPA